MSKGELWFMYSAVICILTLIIAVVSCDIHKNAKITEMVKSGANPIIASCSMGRGTEMACLQALEELK